MRSTLTSLTCLALAAVAAACGDENPTINDAAIDTRSIDSEVMDPDAATTGIVRITIWDFGVPVAGVPVYFQNADDSLVLAGTTGTDGVAEATMMGGGFVSALVPPSNQEATRAPHAAAGIFADRVVTFAAVQPGDELVVGEPPRSTFLIDLAFPTEPTTNNFQIDSTCGGNFIQVATPQPTGLINATIALENCASGRADFAIVAFTADGTQLALVARDAVVAADQGTTLAGTWAPMHTNTVTYQGLAARIVEVGLDQFLATPRGALGHQFGSGFPAAGTATITTTHPVAPATGVVQANIARFFPSSGFSQSVVATWGTHAAATTVTPTPDLLHAYSDFPSYDLSNRRVTWKEAAGGASPDFAVAYLAVARPSQKRTWRWHIVAPYSAASITLPVVPTDVADYNPTVGDDVAVAQLFTYHVPRGYDAAREHAFTDDFAGLVTTPTGRVVREEIFFQPL